MNFSHRNVVSLLVGLTLVASALPATAATTYEELKSRYSSETSKVEVAEQQVAPHEEAASTEEAEWKARLSDTSYMGEIPAASGTYLVALSLASDGSYRRIDQYGNKKNEVFEIEGSWKMTSATILELASSDGEKSWFIVEANGKITMCDEDGKRAASGLNYTLGRFDEINLFEGK